MFRITICFLILSALLSYAATNEYVLVTTESKPSKWGLVPFIERAEFKSMEVEYFGVTGYGIATLVLPAILDVKAITASPAAHQRVHSATKAVTFEREENSMSEILRVFLKEIDRRGGKVVSTLDLELEATEFGTPAGFGNFIRNVGVCRIVLTNAERRSRIIRVTNDLAAGALRRGATDRKIPLIKETATDADIARFWKEQLFAPADHVLANVIVDGKRGLIFFEVNKAEAFRESIERFASE